MKKKTTQTTTSSAIEVMADLCGIPRKKLAKEIKDRLEDRHTIWVMKEPKSGLYLFRRQDRLGGFLGNIVSLILGNEFVFAHTKKAIEEKSIVGRFMKDFRLELKPVRITVEIREG